MLSGSVGRFIRDSPSVWGENSRNLPTARMRCTNYKPDQSNNVIVVELFQQPEGVPAADEDCLRLFHSLLWVAERVDADYLKKVKF